MLTGWLSNPGGTPPASVTPPITELAFDFDRVVNFADDYDRIANHADDFDRVVNFAAEIE